MKQALFDRYLKEQLADPASAHRSEQADRYGMWHVRLPPAAQVTGSASEDLAVAKVPARIDGM